MTVGYFAPAPGSRSGVADYAERLLDGLTQFGDVEYNRRDAGVNIYHIGNNGLHREIYRQALATPGIVILHDAVLHHFLLGTLTREEYIEEFVFNYGEWRRQLAGELWEERAGSAVDPRYFAFPMLKRIAQRSLAVIVHNPGAAAIALTHGAKDVRIVPHLFDSWCFADGASGPLFRQRLGIPQGATLFGVFGYLRETKRVDATLRAFECLHARRPDTALLIAGECASRDLARSLDLFARHEAIYRIGHMTEQEFDSAAMAVDAVVNLRYPAAGETSGIAIRMMGLGRPVILSACEETSDLPPGVSLQVEPGPGEISELFEAMALLTDFPDVARQIGRNASEHIRKWHATEVVARQIWQIVTKLHAACAA